MNYAPRKICITAFFVIIVVTIMYGLVPLKCHDCNQRTVNKKFLEIHDKAQTGDLILVNSSDFFSNMIRDVDGCEFAGAKLVYEAMPGKKSIIISDASNLSDATRGLMVNSMFEYFDDYDDVQLALFRLKDGMSADILKRIEKLADRAFEGNDVPVPYDFAFDNDNRTSMTCSKIILSAFGENNLLDRSVENRAFLKTTLACDLNMDKVVQLTPWISFWEQENE